MKEENTNPNLIISRIIARDEKSGLTQINVPESQFKMFAKQNPDIAPTSQKEQLDGYTRRIFSLGNATLFTFYRGGNTKLFISNADCDKLTDASDDIDISIFDN